MLFKITKLMWQEYRVQAIVSTLLLFFVGFLNGLSIITIVPLINTAGSSAEKNKSFIQNIFNKLFGIFGLEATFLNILVFLLILFIVKALLNIFQAVLLRWMQTKIEIDKKTSLYNSLLNTELTYLYQCNFGRITSIIIVQSTMVAYLVELFSRFLTGIINLVIYVAIVFLVSWQLTIITTLISGIIYYVGRKAFIKARQYGYEIAVVQSRMQELVNYTLSGYKIVKSFVLEDVLKKRIADLLNRLKLAYLKSVITESLLRSVFEPLVLVIAVCVYAFYQFELAAFLTFLVALYRMYGSFQELQNTHYKMAGHVPSLEMYEETLSGFNTHQYPDINRGIEFQTLERQITFKQVSYAYKISKSPFVLGPVTIAIEKGKMVGLVGRSGSGKSTCVDLLVGLLQPDIGTIEVDGTELYEYSLASFRKKVAYVSQDIFLLNDTIYKNITFSDDSITLERVKEACAMAYATDFIEELPEKYQTVLGEHGTRLSGGQKQRIALARALVRNPEILILDEATSSLDNESEKQVQMAIDLLSGNITIIVIAHRLSTVKNADYIYMFEDGGVIEQGTFDSLLQQQGKFFDMYSMAQ